LPSIAAGYVGSVPGAAGAAWDRRPSMAAQLTRSPAMEQALQHAVRATFAPAFETHR
jgi:hypothetical protein